MDVGSRTEWDARIPAEEIARRKDLCLRRLGIEIAPWLRAGGNRIVMTETIEHTDDFGLSRTVYTLLATIEPV